MKRFEVSATRPMMGVNRGTKYCRSHKPSGNKYFEKTPSIVKRIFWIALSFCIFKQLHFLVTVQRRVLSLSKPDEVGRYLETGVPPLNEFGNDRGINQIGRTHTTVEIEREAIQSALRKGEEIRTTARMTNKTWYRNTTQFDDDGGLAFEVDRKFESLNSTSLTDGLKVKTRRIQNKRNRRRRKGQARRRDPYDDRIERAMFVISMGEKAAKTKTIERFVYSARNNGKYSDWIVVLTDAPAGRYDGMKNWTYGVVVMEPKEEDLKTHFEIPNMIYKRFKTLAIEYMDRDPRLNNVELVYYLDADIVFGDNMNKAFTGMETTYGIGPLGSNTTNTTSLGARGKMWMFKGNSEKWQIQGGQIILDRKKSQPCLERWRKGFDDEATAKMGKDQFLLMEIKAEMEEARNAKFNKTKTIDNTGLECEIQTMEQAPYIDFPTVSKIRQYSRALKKDPKKKINHAPMVHVRNDGGTATMKDKNIRPYIANLLRFRKGQRDRLGILKKVQMETT